MILENAFCESIWVCWTGIYFCVRFGTYSRRLKLNDLFLVDGCDWCIVAANVCWCWKYLVQNLLEIWNQNIVVDYFGPGFEAQLFKINRWFWWIVLEWLTVCEQICHSFSFNLSVDVHHYSFKNKICSHVQLYSQN